MKTNNAKGRFNAGELVFDIILLGAMYTGLQYVNYGAAVLIGLVILSHIGYNLTHLPSTLIYLIEAALDVGCILLLTLYSDVKQHFTNKWSEILQLFNK